MNSLINSGQQFIYIAIVLTIGWIPSPVVSEPGIASHYRRALSMSNHVKDSPHPIFTLINDGKDMNGLHSHDNVTINPDDPANNELNGDPGKHILANQTNTGNDTSRTMNSTTLVNNTVSDIMMSSTDPHNTTAPTIDLISDIHDASAKLISDWGLGWDSKIARVAQVLLGLLIYYTIMVIKGFIISWGIDQAAKQVSNFTNQDSNKMDLLSNLVNLAVNNLAAKFSS